MRIHKGRAHFQSIEFTCHNCRKTFQQSAKAKPKKYCGKKCKYKHLTKRYAGAGNPAYKGGFIDKVCENCEKAFRVERSSPRRYSRFCSKSCFSKKMWEAGRPSYVLNGFRFRTALHLDYARYLTDIGLTWFYRPKCFSFQDMTFKPDFYISEWNMFVHVPKKPTRVIELKIKSFLDEYPCYELKVLFPDELYQITNME